MGGSHGHSFLPLRYFRLRPCPLFLSLSLPYELCEAIGTETRCNSALPYSQLAAHRIASHYVCALPADAESAVREQVLAEVCHQRRGVMEVLLSTTNAGQVTAVRSWIRFDMCKWK